MENKKSMSPILIIVLTVLGICLVGFLVFMGVKYFKGSPETPKNSTTVYCGDEYFIISKDTKTKVPELPSGPGWSGGAAGINYYLNSDNSLVYETWVDVCEKYEDNEETECLTSKTLTSKRVDTGYKCEYLFESENTLATNIEDPITYGICYINGKYYEIGFKEMTCSNKVDSCKPYIVDISSNCSMK